MVFGYLADAFLIWFKLQTVLFLVYCNTFIWPDINPAIIVIWNLFGVKMS